MGQTSSGERETNTKGFSLDPTLVESTLKKIDKIVETEEMSVTAEAQYYTELIRGITNKLHENITR